MTSSLESAALTAAAKGSGIEGNTGCGAVGGCGCKLEILSTTSTVWRDTGWGAGGPEGCRDTATAAAAGSVSFLEAATAAWSTEAGTVAVGAAGTVEAASTVCGTTCWGCCGTGGWSRMAVAPLGLVAVTGSIRAVVALCGSPCNNEEHLVECFKKMGSTQVESANQCCAHPVVGCLLRGGCGRGCQHG